MLEVKTYNGGFSLAREATVVTGLTEALTDTCCRKGDLSPNQEAAGLCRACGGAGFVAGLEHPSLESGCCCPHCEAGRLLVERIAEIVGRARVEERSRRDAYRLRRSFQG